MQLEIPPYERSIEMSCWSQVFSEVEKLSIVKFAVDLLERLDPLDLKAGVCGRRWNKNMTLRQIGEKLSRTGAGALDALKFRSISTPLDFDIQFWSGELHFFSLICPDHIFLDKNGWQNTTDLLFNLNTCYAHIHWAKDYPLIRNHTIMAERDDRAEEDVDEYNPEVMTGNFVDMTAYQHLRFVFESFQDDLLDENGEAFPFHTPMGVFPLSVLSDDHVNLVLPGNMTLSEWIGSRIHRGKLAKIGASKHSWLVEDQCIEKTTRELWKTGLLTCSDFFEIADWDATMQLPILRQVKALVRPDA